MKIVYKKIFANIQNIAENMDVCFEDASVMLESTRL
jgi:hypothetical protein